MTRAAVYARVSSGRQEQEETVQSQLEAVRGHAADRGYEVVAEFVDEAYSGATLERPGLDRLRDGARDGVFDAVIILSPDRLARKVGYQFVLLEELQKAGVGVEFVQGQPADTPEGQLLLTMQGAISEYERAKIGERTRRGKLFWAKRGGLMGGYTPFGYRYVPRDGDRRANLEVDEPKASVVRDIFRLVIEEQCSCRRVARTLTERAVPTPGGAARWRESTVNRILRQPAYAGSFLYHRHEYIEPEHPPAGLPYRKNRKTARRPRAREEWIEVPVPAIVDPDTWQRAQVQLGKNARFAGRNNKRHEYLLRGLVRCGRCGASMSGGVSHDRRHYRCCATDPYNVGQRGVCRPRTAVPADWLEAEVWTAIREPFANPDLLREEFERRLGGSPAAGAADQRERDLRREIARIRRQRDRWLDTYQDEEIERDELHRRLGELNRQEREAEAALGQLAGLREERALLRDVEAAFADWADRIHAGLDVLDFAGRQQLLREVLRGVIVDRERGPVRVLTVLPVPSPKARSGPGGSPLHRSPVGLRCKDRHPAAGRLAQSALRPAAPLLQLLSANAEADAQNTPRSQGAQDLRYGPHTLPTRPGIRPDPAGRQRRAHRTLPHFEPGGPAARDHCASAAPARPRHPNHHTEGGRLTMSTFYSEATNPPSGTFFNEATGRPVADHLPSRRRPPAEVPPDKVAVVNGRCMPAGERAPQKCCWVLLGQPMTPEEYRQRFEAGMIALEPCPGCRQPLVPWGSFPRALAEGEPPEMQGLRLLRGRCTNPDCPVCTVTHYPCFVTPYHTVPTAQREAVIRAHAEQGRSWTALHQRQTWVLASVQRWERRLGARAVEVTTGLLAVWQRLDHRAPAEVRCGEGRGGLLRAMFRVCDAVGDLLRCQEGWTAPVPALAVPRMLRPAPPTPLPVWT